MTAKKENKRRFSSRGFTLIELAVVIAVIGFLTAALAVKVDRAIRKTYEGAAKADLGVLRMAVMEYYAANGGEWPDVPLEESLIPGYLNKMPRLNLENHPASREVKVSTITDSGGWSYYPQSGKTYIDCTHSGLEGEKFSSW